MVSFKVICLFLAITMVTSKKVKLLCEDKSSFCGQVSEEQKCESDLAKLICRKSCNHCKCADADSGFCKADDICGSTEGRLLCAKKCNACEFTMVDDDEEPPKGPKEAELEKPKEQEKEDAQKAKEQAKEDAKKAKEIEDAEEKAKEKEKEDAKKAKEKEEQDKAKEEVEPETNNKDDEKNKDDKPADPEKAEDCLKFHNKYRENHEDTPPMEWDETLAKGAEEYAKKLAETDEFKHSNSEDRNGAGENLFYRAGKFDNSVCEYGIANWYNEINNFDFNTKKGRGTGHFTQVVWKKSTKLGCGFGKKGSKEMLVCRYIEAGNMGGEYKTQVGDLKKDVTMDVIKSQMKDAGVSDDFKRRNSVSKLLRKSIIL